MRPRNVVRTLTAVGAVTALCTFVAPAHATAATCPTGDLCLQETNGTTVFVPSGSTVDFNPALNVDLIQNNTTLTYCVGVGLVIFDPVRPGGTITGDETVFEVQPGPVCPG
jgi:hypothetical protein